MSVGKGRGAGVNHPSYGAGAKATSLISTRFLCIVEFINEPSYDKGNHIFVVTREADIRIRFYLVDKSSLGYGGSKEAPNIDQAILNTNCNWFEQKYKELNADASLTAIPGPISENQEESKEESKSADVTMTDQNEMSPSEAKFGPSKMLGSGRPTPSRKKTMKNDKDCAIF